MVLHLFGNQVLLGDLALFVLGVARERNDLHPVQKWARHVVAVRGGQEHHVREVILNLKIVVHKGAILFRIKHFEHRRGRIATEVLPHLVDLIEQDQRVRGLGLFQRLNDLARHGANVGPAVAADLGLVAHATQRNPDELATRRLGHGFAQRGFTHARRANKAQDRTFEFGRTLLHREIFNDTFFHLFKTIVVLVEDILRAAQILFDAGFGAPRDRQHPVEVVAHNCGLGRHRRHVLELLDLGIGLFTGLFRQFRAFDLLFQLGNFASAIFAVAKFLLNGFHLLIQIVLALGLLHLRLDAGLDLFLDLQHRQFGLHQRIDLLQPLADRQGFQKLLLAVHLDAEMTRHEVGQFGRLGGFTDGGQRLFGDVLAHLGIALELITDSAQQRLGGGHIAGHFRQRLGAGLKERVVVQKLGDLHPLMAFDQHLHGAVGQLQQLQHIGQHASAVDTILIRIVLGRVDLAGQENLLVIGHDFFEGMYRLLPAHEQRHDHVGENHDVAQRQYGVGGIERLLHTRSFFLARRPGPVCSATAVVSSLGLFIWSGGSRYSTALPQTLSTRMPRA